ncbi:MAG: TRAP transporter small permease subunit [Alphaproteobacteria bacterium]|jgi:TRAP-type mannitol/chloroaromatic compound transport system permease small subunit|nr:TRAP transporter small permease subunit [Alphaproteobacteria bacterium]
MPDLTFVLPHWLYWAGLVVFPLIAMAMVKRRRTAGPMPAVSLPLGYMLLLTAGFVGLHRFYLKSWQGVLYLPLFVGILFANVEARDAREARSLAETDVLIADYDVEDAEAARAAGEEGAEGRLAAANATRAGAQAALGEAAAGFERWSDTALYLAIAIAVLVLLDAVLLPGLVRRRNNEEAPSPVPEAAADDIAPSAGALARLSRFTGEFVAYWSVIAVFVYYYEVLARYIFNSPTNWVHESMFLMFGMQYLISGAYAYLADSHVRVDVFYARLSARAKAVTDLLTSVFFFVFAGTLLWTGITFFMDAMGVWEVSFTEWAIQYWPVKATVVLGALLILLQGLAKLAEDAAILLGKRA